MMIEKDLCTWRVREEFVTCSLQRERLGTSSEHPRIFRLCVEERPVRNRPGIQLPFYLGAALPVIFDKC
jgi:hypothetical protein